MEINGITLEDKWGDVDICGAGDPFNIDAKLNGAYIVMGLLYGEGDPLKTLEISTRCGQDSDCNPSNALAVLGVIKGFSNLPDDMKDGIKAISDSTFINTNYSFNKAVESTYNYAIGFIKENDGKVTREKLRIKVQKPVPLKFEVAFPDMVYDRTVSVFDKDGFILKGAWKKHTILSGQSREPRDQAMVSGKAGDELIIKFEGTGISLNGNWFRDGGRADIYLDNQMHRTIDTYYYFSSQQHSNVSLWHATGLQSGQHTVKLVVRGEKRPESDGTSVYITGVIIFKTASKKNENWKFSFEE
ncbi:MAG: ADP-ribosylglycohydrolase family protein [Bacteroidales bacterium]|nr:ADP-ribosylglycohydrolase family protein [Bacteroidales bacterium]